MTASPAAVFERIADDMAGGRSGGRSGGLSGGLSGGRAGVDRGRMMSAPGIRYDSKVFAFFWRDAMVFRLGRQYDPAADGMNDVEHLNPFKNKPPMKDWFVVPAHHCDRWPALADAALAHMVRERG